MAGVSLVLYGGGVDGDTSGFLLGRLVDLVVLDVFGFGLFGEVLGDGGGEGGLAVIDVPDRAHYLTCSLPFTWVFERSNLANARAMRVVSGEPSPIYFESIDITTKN